MLVSIVVATYNSEKFISETLDSIKCQTYKELELIISDDSSTDKTVDICKAWLKNHNNRFLRAELLTAPFNTGTSLNCNRGLAETYGEWIKFCAGDDKLMPDCIRDNMEWVSSQPEAKVLFSKVNIFKNLIVPDNLLKTIPDDPYNQEGIMAPDRPAESQYKMLLVCDRIHYTPSVFFHRGTLKSIGGFDERFRLLEDYPLWLILTRKGYKLNFMNKVTVNYRQHSAAINNMQIDYLIKPNYFRNESFRKIYTYPNLPFEIMLLQRFNWCTSQIFRMDWLNRNKKSNIFLLKLLTVYLNPFQYYIYFKKHLNKGLINNEFYM